MKKNSKIPQLRLKMHFRNEKNNSKSQLPLPHQINRKHFLQKIKKNREKNTKFASLEKFRVVLASVFERKIERFNVS